MRVVIFPSLLVVVCIVGRVGIQRQELFRLRVERIFQFVKAFVSRGRVFNFRQDFQPVDRPRFEFFYRDL